MASRRGSSSRASTAPASQRGAAVADGGHQAQLVAEIADGGEQQVGVQVERPVAERQPRLVSEAPR